MKFLMGLSLLELVVIWWAARKGRPRIVTLNKESLKELIMLYEDAYHAVKDTAIGWLVKKRLLAALDSLQFQFNLVRLAEGMGMKITVGCLPMGHQVIVNPPVKEVVNEPSP